jgi:hypothetical protein
MKTEEDEAFDELARRQGAWGGGFQAKRKAAADKLQEPINLLEARRIAAEYGTPDSQVDNGNLYFALSKCLEHIDAQPAQEPWANLTAQEWFNLGCFSVEEVRIGLAIQAKLKEKNT